MGNRFLFWLYFFCELFIVFQRVFDLQHRLCFDAFFVNVCRNLHTGWILIGIHRFLICILQRKGTQCSGGVGSIESPLFDVVVFGTELSAVVFTAGAAIIIIVDDHLELTGAGNRNRIGIIEPHEMICFRPFHDFPAVPVQLAVFQNIVNTFGKSGRADGQQKHDQQHELFHIGPP